MPDLQSGAVVAGYRIEALVGRGGMGVVYRAVQTRLNRVVALKVIAPALVGDQLVRERFLEEARAAAGRRAAPRASPRRRCRPTSGVS